MPASAYGLVLLFAALSAAAGWLAARIVGPRRWWTIIVPALAAFGALYFIGHRWALRIGPQANVFGWEISLAFEVAVAVAVALVVALAQRLGLRLLDSQEHGARRDGLA